MGVNRRSCLGCPVGSSKTERRLPEDQPGPAANSLPLRLNLRKVKASLYCTIIRVFFNKSMVKAEVNIKPVSVSQDRSSWIICFSVHPSPQLTLRPLFFEVPATDSQSFFSGRQWLIRDMEKAIESSSSGELVQLNHNANRYLNPFWNFEQVLIF